MRRWRCCHVHAVARAVRELLLRSSAVYSFAMIDSGCSEDEAARQRGTSWATTVKSAARRGWLGDQR